MREADNYQMFSDYIDRTEGLYDLRKGSDLTMAVTSLQGFLLEAQYAAWSSRPPEELSDYLTPDEAIEDLFAESDQSVAEIIEAHVPGYHPTETQLATVALRSALEYELAR